ncbi:MAG: hypothetical protein KatS3mg077_0748 [Candidatus Binatia bacterium]|nr:MAG: hypothetical protein KatS3mg077_0748 [Candidatus Binatia bacterium]
MGSPAPFGVTPGAAYVFLKPSGGWATTSSWDAKLAPSDGDAGDRFGDSVAIDGDVVVVGAPTHDTNGNMNRGAAYVFVKPAGGWSGNLTQSAKLVAGDGMPGDWFGDAVRISGNAIVAGAPFSGADDPGAAYVFVKPAGGWSGTLTHNAKLVASNNQDDAELGVEVDIDGDTVLAGAPFFDLGMFCTNAGRVYVFTKPAGGWSGTLNETAFLQTASCVSDGWLGLSVAIDGDVAVAGAPNMASGAGRGFVFVKPISGWVNMSESATLTASDASSGDQLGYSVAISGDTVIAGAQQPGGPGKAYVYAKPPAGWSGSISEAAKLVASDGEISDLFGAAVGFYPSVTGGTVVVGAYQDDINPTDQGSAYVFEFQQTSSGSPTSNPSTPTATPTDTPSPTVTPTSSSAGPMSPTPTVTPSPSATGSATPSPTATASATPSPTPTPSASPTQTRSPTGSPTVTPTRSQFERAAGDFACSDDFDNDGDGAVDCADPDCSGSVRCAASVPVGARGAWFVVLMSLLVYGVLRLGWGSPR